MLMVRGSIGGAGGWSNDERHRRWRVQEQKEREVAAELLEAREQARLATGSNFLVRAGSGI